MARTDTLPHFLTDVADAIRSKTGDSNLINASSFDTAITNIPSGGEHTGAYKVSSVSEMNAIEDMEDGDYCIIAEEYIAPSTKDYKTLSLQTLKQIADETVGASISNNIMSNSYGKYIMIQSTPTGDMLTFYAITNTSIELKTYTGYESNAGLSQTKYGQNGYAIYYNLTTKQQWANYDVLNNSNIAVFNNNNYYPMTNPLNNVRTVQSSFKNNLTVSGRTSDFLSLTDTDSWGLVNFNGTNYSLYQYNNNSWVKIFDEFIPTNL